jgi:hypothetical protein
MKCDCAATCSVCIVYSVVRTPGCIKEEGFGQR